METDSSQSRTALPAFIRNRDRTKSRIIEKEDGEPRKTATLSHRPESDATICGRGNVTIMTGPCKKRACFYGLLSMIARVSPFDDREVLVVGGGPAGATAARTLALAGVRVRLLDRCAFPRNKPCGGG